MKLQDYSLEELIQNAKEHHACDRALEILSQFNTMEEAIDGIAPGRIADFCLWYAREVIKDRWPAAEPIIIKDPWSACTYAKDVIKDRWPEAEPYIVKDPMWASEYQKTFKYFFVRA